MDRRLTQTEPQHSLSAFDANAATGIAQRAARRSRRTQSKPPLVGQEANLLVALRQAELAHAQTLKAINQQKVEAQEAAPARRGRRPGVSQTGGRHHLAPLRAFITVLKVFWESATRTRFGYEVERGEGVPGGVAPRSAAARLVSAPAREVVKRVSLRPEIVSAAADLGIAPVMLALGLLTDVAAAQGSVMGKYDVEIQVLERQLATARQEIAEMETGLVQHSDVRNGRMVVVNDELLHNAKARIKICERLIARYRLKNY